MMIIKDDDLIYNIPLKDGINIIIDNEYTDGIVNYLMSYFMNKKKNVCTIYDEENIIITPKEYEYIYVPTKDVMGNYDFKDKSILKTYFTNVIMDNPEMFLTIENIRDNMHYLLSDAGMYKLKKILEDNLDVNYELEINDFNIGKLVEMLKIDTDDLNVSELQASLYNVILSFNEMKNNIIYIDFDIDANIEKWLLKNVKPNNIILINSKRIKELSIIDECNVIIPKLSKNTIFDELNIDYINLFLYMMNPYILKYLHYQKENNINFISDYIAEETTFSIYFK